MARKDPEPQKERRTRDDDPGTLEVRRQAGRLPEDFPKPAGVGGDRTAEMNAEEERQRFLHRGEIARAEAMGKETSHNDATAYEGNKPEMDEAHAAADEAVPPEDEESSTARRGATRKKG